MRACVQVRALMKATKQRIAKASASAKLTHSWRECASASAAASVGGALSVAGWCAGREGGREMDAGLVGGAWAYLSSVARRWCI